MASNGETKHLSLATFPKIPISIFGSHADPIGFAPNLIPNSVVIECTCLIAIENDALCIAIPEAGSVTI